MPISPIFVDVSNGAKKNTRVFFLAIRISSSRKQTPPLEFRRFLTLVRDFDTLSPADRRQSSCLRRRDLLHRGFRQKRAIYIPRYTHVRFLRLDGISKRRDVSPTARLRVEITEDYVRRNCPTYAPRQRQSSVLKAYYRAGDNGHKGLDLQLTNEVQNIEYNVVNFMI